MKRPLLSLQLGMLLAAVASACQAELITYVDASDGAGGNTALSAGGVFTAVASPGGANNDDAWSKRSPFANGGSVFTSNDSGSGATAEDAPGLATTISGLVAGNAYEVFAYFWDGNGNWRLKASLRELPPLPNNTPGERPVSFSADGSASSTASPQAVAADFVVAPLISEGDRRLRQAALGRIRANASGQIVVYIDDLENPTVSTTQRTWYDGVGYALVPEPTSFVTFCIGMIALSLFRAHRAV